MKTSRYTLYELNEHIRRIMALNFTEALWISCELAQVSLSRGHLYLSLIEKEDPDPILEDEGQIIAQSDAVIWARNYQTMKLKLGKQLDEVLQPGLEVLVKAKVDYHERYGLKLNLVDIDPAFTVGKLAIRRREVLERLQSNGLLEKNKSLSLPSVLQNIAVISSSTAAGFQDFRKQIRQNSYDYRINYTLFEAAMQGDRVRPELIRQLDRINRSVEDFDCVVVIRGGGARLDLLAFDEEEVCTALANCKLPVITGIGHEIDETLADIVAFYSLKTPTAVAEWLIQWNLQFEVELLDVGNVIKQEAKNQINTDRLEVERYAQAMLLYAKSALQRQDQLLTYTEEELPQASNRILKSKHQQLEYMEQALVLLDPQKILDRGFSMTTKNGLPIAQAAELTESDVIETIFSDGRIKSKVLKG